MGEILYSSLRACTTIESLEYRNGSSLSFDQLSSVFNAGNETDNKSAKLNALNNGSISSQVANFSGQALGYGNYISPGSNIDFG